MDYFSATRLASYLLGLLVTTIVVLSSVYAQNTSPLHLEKEIPLPGVEGRIDHFSADVRGQRLFIAALENGTVEVLDIRKGERSTEIKGLRFFAGYAAKKWLPFGAADFGRQRKSEAFCRHTRKNGSSR